MHWDDTVGLAEGFAVELAEDTVRLAEELAEELAEGLEVELAEDTVRLAAGAGVVVALAAAAVVAEDTFLAEELADDTPNRFPHAVKPPAYLATTTHCQKSVP